MPTSRPRHTLTETDELKDVLDRARQFFPDVESRAGLIHALLALGAEELKRQEARLARVEQERLAQLGYLADISTGRIDALDPTALTAVRHARYG